MPKPSAQELLRRRSARILVAALALLSVWALGYLLSVPVVSLLARIFIWVAGSIVAVWLLWRAYQRLLWRVSGRLAFSYFLIGVLPIPLAAALLALVAYMISGFFLGHLYRDTLHELELEIETAAAHAAARDLSEIARDGTGRVEGVAYGVYRGGRRVAGDPEAPETWPGWLGGRSGARAPAYAVLPGGSMTLAAVGGTENRGVVAFYAGDLGELLRRRSALWVSLLRNVEGSESARISIGSAGFNLRTDPMTPEEVADLQARKDRFFEQQAVGEDFRDDPLLSWVEVEEPARELASGKTMGGELAVLLTASPRILARRLFSPSAEVGQVYWVALLGVSLLLLAIYAIAEIVALAMIVGISRAVTRLYDATSRVASGDFSVRIPVRRRDQVGALQRSFNGMAESLEDLVATAAQKELLEKELQIARQVQQSLIPRNLPRGETVEFSTLFEPSAAIGGDYFDVLRLSDRELAVVVADVSGHGLPTGLRMAMVKAALGILIAETDEPQEILRRLDATVRSGHQRGEDSRFFVTATFARVDFRRGVIDLTNAGHPPTYLLRNGTVEEILLPSSPLGGLGHDYAERRIDLENGDVVVWLSDGMLEAVDGDDDPFGYDRMVRALEGPAPTPAAVRDRLLAAIESHTGGRPARDDRTLVVMHYHQSE